MIRFSGWIAKDREEKWYFYLEEPVKSGDIWIGNPLFEISEMDLVGISLPCYDNSPKHISIHSSTPCEANFI